MIFVQCKSIHVERWECVRECTSVQAYIKITRDEARGHESEMCKWFAARRNESTVLDEGNENLLQGGLRDAVVGNFQNCFRALNRLKKVGQLQRVSQEKRQLQVAQAFHACKRQARHMALERTCKGMKLPTKCQEHGAPAAAGR